MSRICLFVLVSVTLLSPVVAESIKERFGSIDKWEFIYTQTSSSPYQWKDGPINRFRSQVVNNQSGRIIITGQPGGGNELFLEGRGTSTASYHHIFHEWTQYYAEMRYDHHDGPAESLVRVKFRLNAGTYDVNIQPGTVNGKYGGTRKSFNSNSKYGPVEGHSHVHIITIPTDRMKLPESGTTITGNYSFEQQIGDMTANSPDFKVHEWAKRSPTSGSIKWIMIPMSELDVELIVEVEDYANWMPTGGADETKAGSVVPIKATLISKDGGPLKVQAKRMHFTLMECSREPGVALNLPVKDAKDSFDLAFEETNNPGWNFGDAAQSATTPEGAYETATAKVSCFDWGAYGSMVVTAYLTNGRTVVGHLKGESGKFILLPKRDTASKIADKWKAQAGFTGPDVEDEDKQAKNENLGDGLTAYEEYRGLIVRGAHTRLEPKKKNLVIENHVGEKVRPGIKLFETASGVDVVELDKGELPENRRANLNAGSIHGGDQFGMRIIAGALTTTAGENQPAAELGKTPKKSERIVIDLDQAAEQFAGQSAVARAAGIPMPYTLDDDIANTIAHEIAHGVHVAHHGKPTEFFGHRRITERMKDWHVYGIDGTRVDVAGMPDKVIKLEGSIGRLGNEASGDTGCIMAYVNLYNWAAVGPESGPMHFFAVGLHAPGKTFCTSTKGTGFNLPRKFPNGASLPGFFGDATNVRADLPSGNCLGQMQVKDW